jgi:hypothetical protein
MDLSTTPQATPWPATPRGALAAAAAAAVVWAVAAGVLFVLVPGLETLPRLLVFSECVGLTMLACALLLQRQRRLAALASGRRWLLTGLIAIPAGYLVGHQIAFLLLGEPMRMVGHQHISLVPMLFTLLVGGLGLRHVVTREQLAREAAARAEAQRLALEAQLRLLRTQLEPHMLFNTLANLRGLVREDADSAEAMIDRLIVYLRATLAASQTDTVPLHREFAQLQAYLGIMALRMGPRLSFRLTLPDGLRDTPVPPMLLQPLVENAIRHGLEPKVGPGHITVTACSTGNGIAVHVDDDGLGLATPDQAPAPETGADDAARSGYGLRHVRERLQAVHGPGARLDIVQRQPAGVRSSVFLPL